MPEHQRLTSNRFDRMQQVALVVEKAGVPAFKTVVEINQKSEVALLVGAFPKKGAVRVLVESLARFRAVKTKRSLSDTKSQPSHCAGKNGRARSNKRAASSGSSTMTRVLLRMSWRITVPPGTDSGASRKPAISLCKMNSSHSPGERKSSTRKIFRPANDSFCTLKV